ncbi:Rad17 cell cycle checkpoint protein-domain-containing protein [Limtongia smithiae]|uniref:Rad17 cell cycle checkpoint protein-domain-containing protein n=1 Tax=Limtongia smithiae TaxID=1125753 RepID=UPI0034CECCA9
MSTKAKPAAKAKSTTGTSTSIRRPNNVKPIVATLDLDDDSICESIDEVSSSESSDREVTMSSTASTSVKEQKRVITRRDSASLQPIPPQPTTATQLNLQTFKETTPPSKVESQSVELWTEKYAPTVYAKLALHKRKYDDVRDWFTRVFSGTMRQRVLVMTGPAGSCKTATLSVLSRELGFDIIEWTNSLSPVYTSDEPYESVYSRFAAFLADASRFGSAVIVEDSKNGDGEVVYKINAAQLRDRKRILLIEDIPSSLIMSTSDTRTRYIEAISAYIYASLKGNRTPPPLVFVLSEADQFDEFSAQQAYSAETILGREIMADPLVTKIQFNPVNKTLMARVLKDTATAEGLFQTEQKAGSGGVKTVIASLLELGDVRCAITALQTWSITGGITVPAMRESNLQLFHAVGKVVYNKVWKDDNKDSETESPLDTLLQSIAPTKLVDGVFENYPPSCIEVDNLELCSDALSLADVMLAMSNIGSSNVLKSLRWQSDYGNGNTNSDMLINRSSMRAELAMRGVLAGLPATVTRFPFSSKDFVSRNRSFSEVSKGSDRKRAWSSFSSGGNTGGRSSLCMALGYSVYKRQRDVQTGVLRYQTTQRKSSASNGISALVEDADTFMQHTAFWEALIRKDEGPRKIGGFYSANGATGLGDDADDEQPNMNTATFYNGNKHSNKEFEYESIFGRLVFSSGDNEVDEDIEEDSD